MADVFLSIADFIIQLRSEFGETIECDEGYQPFMTTAFLDSDVVVQAFDTPFEHTSTKKEKLYTAFSEGQLFWEIFEHDEGFQIVTYVQTIAEQTIQQIAIASSDFSNWKIYTQYGNPKDPMTYPLGPLILYTITTQHQALMIHSSGVSYNGQGHLFSAISGTGKSTMASLWQQCGATIINDDRLIIRKLNNEYMIHNTPMYYGDSPRQEKLKSIHLISQSKEPYCHQINGVKALALILGNTIMHNYNPIHIQHHLAFVSELTQHVACYETGFAIDKTIVPFINSKVNLKLETSAVDEQ